MKKLLFVLAIVLIASVAFAQQSPAGQGPSDLNGGLVESWNNLPAGATGNNLGGAGLGRHDLLDGTTRTPLGCETCHLPHTAPTFGKTFLWAWSTVPTSVTTYITATNPSGALLTPNTRTGNSRSMLCLTCHDGTSASANNITGNVVTNGSPYPLINTSGGTGSLGSQHPVDAIFPNNTEYVQPVVLASLGAEESYGTAGVDALPLWSTTVGSVTGAAVECSTCHDPHNDYQSNQGTAGGVPFLRVANTNGVYLCRECHNQ